MINDGRASGVGNGGARATRRRTPTAQVESAADRCLRRISVSPQLAATVFGDQMLLNVPPPPREAAWVQLRLALRKYPNDPSGALPGLEATAIG